jgi:putative hydrolase of the HAD superfamily
MDRVLEDHGLHETEAGMLASKLWLFQGCEHLVQPYEGCLELVRALAGVHTLGVITNGPIHPQTIKFEALRMVEHFHPELFVTSEHAGCFKPDEAIFRYALERAGVEPHEAVHVGDSLEADVAGAQGAGMRAVWFNAKGQQAEDGVVPDATVTSYGELAGALMKWTMQ